MTPRPDSVWTPSPNFRSPRRKPVSVVVLHATAGGFAGALQTLTDPAPDNPDGRVSAHYLIDTDGRIFHLVHESDEAWHAGVSEWAGVSNVNDFSVGIELVNPNDGATPYAPAQIAAAAALVKAICSDYLIEPQNVVGHLDIAPGRKTDPAAFAWEDFRNRLLTS